MKLSDTHAGMKIGALTLVEHVIVEQYGVHRNAWRCICDCGNEVIRTVGSFGKSKFPFCGRPGCQAQPSVKYEYPAGVSYKDVKKVYMTWYKIKSRCEDITDKDYPRYGGRGIKLSKEWHDYNTFLSWYLDQSNGEILPAKEQTVDRINVEKGYSESNCRLVDMVAQSNNRRTNQFVEVRGEKLTYTQCAQKYGMKKDTVRWRYLHGKRGEDIIKGFSPLKFPVFGKMMTINDMVEQFNLPKNKVLTITRDRVGGMNVGDRGHKFELYVQDHNVKGVA